MNRLYDDVAGGGLFLANAILAIAGNLAVHTLEDGAKVFAALATGFWFVTQTILAIRAAQKKRDRARRNRFDE